MYTNTHHSSPETDVNTKPRREGAYRDKAPSVVERDQSPTYPSSRPPRLPSDRDRKTESRPVVEGVLINPLYDQGTSLRES